MYNISLYVCVYIHIYIYISYSTMRLTPPPAASPSAVEEPFLGAMSTRFPGCDMVLRVLNMFKQACNTSPPQGVELSTGVETLFWLASAPDVSYVRSGST